MSFGNIILKLWKIQYNLPPKLAIDVEKQTVLWMVTVFRNALFTKHLLVQLLINITMVLAKILSKNVTITIIVLLEINLVKRTLNCSSTNRNWMRKILINLLIRLLLWNCRNMFVHFGIVIYAFVRSSLFHEQILMFRSIKVISLSQNARIELDLLWSVLKIDKIIYTIQCM